MTFKVNLNLSKYFVSLFGIHNSFNFQTLIMAEANPSNGYFTMGLDTLKVPVELFAENRRRLCERLRGLQEVSQGACVILLQGGGDQGRCEGDSSDVGPIFRQESYFHWCFGVLEPDYFGKVSHFPNFGIPIGIFVFHKFRLFPNVIKT